MPTSINTSCQDQAKSSEIWENKLVNDSFHNYLLQSYIKRLATFEGWTCRYVNPKDLALNGFTYHNLPDYMKDTDLVKMHFQNTNGLHDIVYCLDCEIFLHCWEENDDPYSEHKRMSPDCVFVKYFPSFNFNPSDESIVNDWFNSRVVNQYVLLGINSIEHIRKGLTIQLNTRYRNFNSIEEIIEFFKIEFPENDDILKNFTNICKTCYSKEIKIAFLYCGHSIACLDCAYKFKVYPLCRKPILVYQKLYF